jgi:thioredoxin reductase (NADPH)
MTALQGTTQLLDCAVIGGGPAGMTAALYLLRFHRRILVFDAMQSRARWIPSSHNCPGFPGGISGTALLDRLRKQVSEHGIENVYSRITQLKTSAAGFMLTDEAERTYEAATVVLATGVIDELPAFPWIPQAIEAGAIRLCAICDAFEATDSQLATFGPTEKAVAHARFLRSYSASVTAVTTDTPSLGDSDLEELRTRGISLLVQASMLEFDGKRCTVVDSANRRTTFDSIYPVMGSRSQSDLAKQLHAKLDDNDELIVDRHQMTSIDGLFAVGDIVSAINQISVGVGHAAIAATAIHNRLPARRR